MNITANETAVLDCIARNLYQPSNGGVPDSYDDTAPIWTWMLLSDTTSTYTGTVKLKSLPGIVASLSKKGLVHVADGRNRKEDTVALTVSGFAAWEALQGTGAI